ncbi:hypothetical protein BGZ73_002909 [Actinomortierella ambigua]|nr:hypothetical protein BGZ73_002909 [Actinomortierella ambigua]
MAATTISASTISASTSAPKASIASTEKLSEVVDFKNTSLTFYYFGLHTHGATPRALLAYADADWKEHQPTDWFSADRAEKMQTIYGTLPLLYDHQGETTVEIAEALNIELYLAEKFDLLGDNAAEAVQIRGAYSNTRALMHRQEDAYFSRKVYQAAERQRFIDTYLTQWIRTHEAVLVKNGSNGHYVGNRTSLADIKTAVAIEQLLNELYDFEDGSHADLINPTATPALWKVRETVSAKDSYRQWRESQAYKDLKAVTQGFFDHERHEL